MINELLNIIIPNNNVPEREYACNILFGVLMQTPYEISVSDVKDTVVKIGNRALIVEDHFFGNFLTPLSYLNKDNIPKGAGVFHDNKGKEIPMIFGNDTLSITDNEIICGNDVLASIYFLTSRWEEYVLGRNKSGKCDENSLYLVNNNISKIPLVHVYETFIKELLVLMGYGFNLDRKFKVITTHDVDRCYLTGWIEMLRNARNLYKIGKGIVAKKLLHDFIWYKINSPNPFDTFGFFMDCADKYHSEDYFFFKACIDGEKGFTYSIGEDRVKRMVQEVQKRGYTVGFHPSETTFDNSTQFKKELNRLDSLEAVSYSGRNHGLYCNTATYHQWEEAHAEFVSNYGFQYQNGFRCGICVPFPLFDIYERVQLNLYEIPFELMDTVMLRNKPQIESALFDMKEIINKVVDYQGVLCMNWHTNVYNMPEMQKYKSVYINLLEYAKQKMD